MSAKAKQVNDCLALLDALSASAEKSVHLIMDGVPDKALAAGVRCDRSELGIRINRALAGLEAYPSVTASLGSFAAALLPSEVGEPHPPTIADIKVMRDRQQILRGVVLGAVYGKWFWRLFRHPIG